MSARRLLCLTLTATAAAAMVQTGPAAAASSLSGAGSTLAAPLVAEWAAAFQVFTSTSVKYDEVGSQAGINDISSRVVDFASTEAGLTPSQAHACGSCFQIPWSLSAVGISYHIAGIRRPLMLTPILLAEIYLGQISHWNDSRLTAVNPRAALPSLKITPIYNGGSGDTYTFTSYLSRVDAAWRRQIGSGFAVSFPTGTPANSVSAAVALTQSTNGAISYVGAPFLVANRMPAAAIQNAAGRFEYPNLSEITSAAKTVKRVPAGNSLQILDPPASARLAYPISTFTYAIVPANAPQKAALAQWISYALGQGQQFGPRIDYPPLPEVVLRASEATLSAFESS